MGGEGDLRATIEFVVLEVCRSAGRVGERGLVAVRIVNETALVAKGIPHFGPASCDVVLIPRKGVSPGGLTPF